MTADPLASFEQIDECTYQSKSVGASRQAEMMSCDCAASYPEGALCTDQSHCINRLTSIECYGDTKCRERCSNHRFQNKEFAALSVFDAGAKGWGVKCDTALEENQFVYEYVGEVIDKAKFERRKLQYDKEGLEHFYFMMLQKDEYIDATRRGSVARFLNHSCNPNCTVYKWVVGPKLRMGIFTIKPVAANEELTFDYNAERFGDNVQECLCGEANCRGVLNGKYDVLDLIPRSVWPIVGLDSKLLEELREVVKKDKQLKKKKELDAEVLNLIPATPLELDQVQAAVTFLMQPQEYFIVFKVVERIASTLDRAVQTALVKMHGYEICGGLLSRYDQPEMVVMLLGILEGWPRLTRNKISSSRIEEVVGKLAGSGNSDVSSRAKALLAVWSELEMAYRIPRKKVEGGRRTEGEGEVDGEGEGQGQGEGEDEPEGERAAPPQPKGPSIPKKPIKLPPGWEFNYSEGEIYYYNRELNVTQWEMPQAPKDAEREERRKRERDEKRREEERKEAELQRLEREQAASDLQRIIDAAQRASETPEPKEAKPNPNPNPKRTLSREEQLERKFTRVLAAYVPKQVFKYNDRLDHDRCKRYAREITKLLVDKEIRKGSEELDLSDSKQKKIKGFISEYIKKVLQHRKEEPAHKRVKTV